MSAERLAVATIRSSRENLANGMPLGQIIEENISVHAESHREVNTYYSKVRNGRIISPDTGLPLIYSFRADTELQRTEIEFFSKYEAWAIDSEATGTAVWVSPPHPEHDGTDSKLIVYKKDFIDGEPAILNRSVNVATKDYMKMGHDLIRNSTEPGRVIFDPELMRSELIILTNDTGWIDILENYTTNKEMIEKIRSDQDILERKQKLNWANEYVSMIGLGYTDNQIVERMIIDGFIKADGGYSCDLPMGQSVSGFFTQNSLQYTEGGDKKYVKKCGNCKVRIEARIGKGYVCSNCQGVYEGC